MNNEKYMYWCCNPKEAADEIERLEGDKKWIASAAEVKAMKEEIERQGRYIKSLEHYEATNKAEIEQLERTVKWHSSARRYMRAEIERLTETKNLAIKDSMAEADENERLRAALEAVRGFCKYCGATYPHRCGEGRCEHCAALGDDDE